MENQVAITHRENLLTTISLPERLASLLNNKNIDWEGQYDKYERDADGWIMAHGRMIKIAALPTLPDEQFDILSDALRAIELILTPPTKQEFATLLTALSQHCGLQNRDAGAMKAMLRDYWSDFGDYPREMIELACKKWRESSDDKARFMPSSGDIIKLIGWRRDSLLKKKYRMERLTGKTPEKPWNTRSGGMVALGDMLRHED